MRCVSETILPIEQAQCERLAEVVLEHIALGGTIYDIADLRGVPASKLWQIVRMLPDAAKRISQAEASGMEVTRDRNRRELGQIAYADIRGIYTESGSLRPISEWPAGAAASIASIKTKRYLEGSGNNAEMVEVVEVKRYDKIKAIELIGKDANQFMERVQVDHTGSIELVGRLQSARQRVEEENRKALEGQGADTSSSGDGRPSDSGSAL